MTLLLFLLPLLAGGDPAEEILFRARHAELVEGNRTRAIELYEQALSDPALPAARRPEAEARLALCLERDGQTRKALALLTEPLLRSADLPEPLRPEAAACRARILAAQRSVASDPPRPPASDASAARRQKARELVQEARRLQQAGEEMKALIRALAALELEAGDAEARALVEELEARLSDASRFVRDALKVVKTWSEARVKVVATRARDAIREGVAAGRKGEINTAEARFLDAIRAIDGCEFGVESEELLSLRQRAADEWRRLGRERRFEPRIPAESAERRSALMAEFLNILQRMLDVVSAGDTEYRILPVESPAARSLSGAQRKPSSFQLRRDEPSGWTAALFARHLLLSRVSPGSWHSRGAFLEAAGSMLVARNLASVLDEVERELKRVAAPDPEPLHARFLLVPVAPETLQRLERHFPGFVSAGAGASPLVHRVLPRDVSLDYVVGYLRDQGCDLSLPRDLFEVEMDNGAPQTLFVSRPLSEAPGYEEWKSPDSFGVLLDVYPLRDAGGRTATALRVLCVSPDSPARAADGTLVPRILLQEASLFAEVPAGSILLASNLHDPFVDAEGARGTGSSLLLVWENPAPSLPAAERPADPPPEEGAQLLEVPLLELLARTRDDPGPEPDAERGFVARDPGGALRARAAFLEGLLREGLGSDEAAVVPAEAVARVPARLREDISALVATLEREAERPYEIRVKARAVRTAVLERWLAREEIALVPFGGAAAAITDREGPDALLRGIAAEPADVFAPEEEMCAFGVLGLQSRHALSAAARTAPTGANLASEPARVVTEGIRVAARPFSWRGALWAEIEIETVALLGAEEERSLEGPVPSWRVSTESSRLAGRIALGEGNSPRTLVVRGLPHPRLSSPGNPVELLVAITVVPAIP